VTNYFKKLQESLAEDFVLSLYRLMTFNNKAKLLIRQGDRIEGKHIVRRKCAVRNAGFSVMIPPVVLPRFYASLL